MKSAENETCAAANEPETLIELRAKLSVAVNHDDTAARKYGIRLADAVARTLATLESRQSLEAQDIVMYADAVNRTHVWSVFYKGKRVFRFQSVNGPFVSFFVHEYASNAAWEDPILAAVETLR